MANGILKIIFGPPSLERTVQRKSSMSDRHKCILPNYNKFKPHLTTSKTSCFATPTTYYYPISHEPPRRDAQSRRGWRIFQRLRAGCGGDKVGELLKNIEAGSKVV